MKIVAETVTAIILLATVLFIAPNLISELRIITFTEVNEGLSSIQKFTIKLTK